MHASTFFIIKTFFKNFRFLFQVLGVVIESLCNQIYMHTLQFADNKFLCQQVSHLLLYLTYMFQSGKC